MMETHCMSLKINELQISKLRLLELVTTRKVCSILNVVKPLKLSNYTTAIAP